MHPLSNATTLPSTNPSKSNTGRLVSSLSAAVTRVTRFRPLGFRPFGLRPVESAMQFASRGKLHCICLPPKVKRPGLERRQVCRTCGLEARKPAVSTVDRFLTRDEIRDIVRSLELAGIRGARVEIPESMTTLRDVNLYLASCDGARSAGNGQATRELNAHEAR